MQSCRGLRSVVTSVALCVVSADLAAQAAPPAAPEQVAHRILEALAREDWLTAAQGTDPAELRRNRLAFDSLVTADRHGYLASRLFQLDSTAQLLRLSDAEFTAGLLRFSTLLRGGREFYRTVRGVEIAGSVPQGRDTVHVVYRWRLAPESAPLRSYLVKTLVACDDGWCANIMGDYSELVRLLKEPMVQAGPPSKP